MTYEISDNIQSIRFVAGGKEALIYKQAIKEITLVHDDVLRLETGESTIVFHHSNVALPSTPTPEVLLGVINEWISDFAPPPL
jgi:Cu/Ag efflux protein CusF